MTTPTRPINLSGMSRDTRTGCPATLQPHWMSLTAHGSPEPRGSPRTVGWQQHWLLLRALGS